MQDTNREKANELFEIIYNARKLATEDNDTEKTIQIKQAINGCVDTIKACIDVNPDLILNSVNTSSEPEVKKFNKAITELSEQEDNLRSQGGGGVSQSFESVLKETSEITDKRVALNTLLYGIKCKRTPTRYSFTTDQGKQGPHTVARCLGVQLRERKIIALYTNGNLTVNTVKELYAEHLDDLWKGIDNQYYKEFYAKVLENYKNSNNAPLAIANGQMLVDLHPLATTNTVASKKDIGGKGEGTHLANWLSNGEEKELEKLVDRGSINNPDNDNKEAYNTYVTKILEHYRTLR